MICEFSQPEFPCQKTFFLLKKSYRNHCHHHHYYITMGKNGYLDYHLVLSPPQQQQQTADNKDSMSRFSWKTIKTKN